MNERIALVEDEPDLAELIAVHLKKEGFHVSAFEDGQNFERSLVKHAPDLILLDLMLPDMSGLDLCRALKRSEKYQSIPIIIVTARGEESDKILGLELGADDYIVKPFSLKELAARIRAVLRRGPEASHPKALTLGGVLVVDPARHEVRVSGKAVETTATEFRLLSLLASNKGRVFTRDQILDHVWGQNKIVLDRTVDVHVKNLRRKLGSASRLLVNVRGVGYKIEE
jgi:DNA-binding response OmpR family regulator